MNTIKECFDLMLHGNENDSRLAARRVRKLLYSAHSGRDDWEDIKNAINSAPGEYAHIAEEWRQEHFVVAVSVLYYLHDKEHQPDFLFPWLFALLLHQNGVIRHAAVRMLQNELGPLTVYIRCPEYTSDRVRKLTPEHADRILYQLFINLQELLGVLWQLRYKKYTYMDELPTSPYKSVQMVLVRMEEYCGKDYIVQLRQRLELASVVQERLQQGAPIFERRKEIEKELVDMLKETESDFSLQDVKDAIFNEEENDDMMKVVAMFDRGGDASELSNILELVTDAWNYFPHKVLGGISPAEKL